jgi:hypothetical protein
MKTIASLTADIADLKERLATARHERGLLLVAGCGLKVGDEFDRGGNQYKVNGISPSENRSEVWLRCHYRTTAGKWSQGTKVVCQTVEGCPMDEIAKIDRMIDENARDAASARSEAQRRGFRENISRLEAVRDALITAQEPPQPVDDGGCDPLYGQRMDSADMGEC